MQYRSDLIFINPLDIRDKNGNIQLSFPNPTANADNYLSVYNGYSGITGQYSGVGFASEGQGANIDMFLHPKGDGIARIYSSNSSYRELIANVSNAIATVDYVERAVTIGVIYLQHVVAVFDTIGSALPTASNGVLIDGQAVAIGDRVLVRSSSDTYNTWIVKNTGTAWEKVEDFLDETNPGSSETHYRVGATVFVDNDSIDPTFTNVRFTWNGTAWVLQYSSNELPYDADFGVTLNGFTFEMDIYGLTLLDETPANDDYIAVWDSNGTGNKHRKVSIANLVPEANPYVWNFTSDTVGSSILTTDNTLSLNSHTDDWVSITHSKTSTTVTSIVQYGLPRAPNRILMTNGNTLGSAIAQERAGVSGKIIRASNDTGLWGTYYMDQFVESTILPLGDGITNGKLVLYNIESTPKYVAFMANSEAVQSTTYKWPDNYPDSDGLALIGDRTGGLSWSAISDTDELVQASSGGNSPGYLDEVLFGTTDANDSGIYLDLQGDNNSIVLRASVLNIDDKAAEELDGTELIALYGTSGNYIINGRTTLDTLSSYYINEYYNSVNNYYNGSIAVVELSYSDFVLNATTGEYVAPIVISTALGITDYTSNWILPIVQRIYNDSASNTVYETIACNTRVYIDVDNDDKGTIDIVFTNAPTSGESFRVTLVLDPTLVNQPR